MATIINQTNWSFAKTGTTVNWTVTIPATTAGSTLVLFCAGGAIVTAKITNTSGAAFNVRANLASGQGISWHDFTAVGGETAVFLTLNGAENVSGTIFEVTGLGAFVAGSTSGGAITPGNANDQQCKPVAANLGANAAGVLFGGWTATATAASNPFSVANQWRQMGPYGVLKLNVGNQPGVNTQFVCAAGVADIANTTRYPLDAASAGDYRATSVWINSTGNTYAAQVLYANAGAAVNPAAVNPTVAENSMPGTNQANWFLTASGSTNANIAGFTDKVSYAPGDTVNFKVDSGNGAFRVEIYRLGYYGWETHGARLMTGNSTGYVVGAPAVQPAPTVDGTLGSASCAWSTTATWTIPAGAPPGVYHVLYRSTVTPANVATGLFVVRGSTVAAKTVVVLPFMTYQAYNVWGATNNTGTLAAGTWTGRSVYAAGADGAATNFAHRAYGVSFDRPYGTQAMQANTWVFDAEYGLIHFAEAQGYDLTYLTDIDLESGSASQLNTAGLVAVLGHHEYWTQGVYDTLRQAQAAKVNMLIVSSNTALWRTRFAVGDTNKRTMICYKDSSSIDVSAGFDGGTGRDPGGYTGTWRDSRTGVAPNNPDVRTENSLTGQLFRLSAHISVAVGVPFANKGAPVWRNSASVQALTAGQTYTSTTGVLGDEVDAADGSAGQPPNLVTLCPTSTGSQVSGANANGTIYTTTVTITAGFTLHRHYSGALIFNTGNWRGWQGVSRWAQATLGGTVTAVDVNWQNALLAALYDLGVTPVAARELRPGTDTALTNPATGAPSGGRSSVAFAYGLRAPEDGGLVPFVG